MFGAMTNPADLDLSRLPANNPAPRHYAAGRFGVECITVTRLMNFTAGNAVKYLWRHTDKGGTDDLRKCIDYLGWTMVDLARGASVWLGSAERMAGQLLLDQWVRPRVTEQDVEWAILLISSGEIAAALELVSAHIPRSY